MRPTDTTHTAIGERLGSSEKLRIPEGHLRTLDLPRRRPQPISRHGAAFLVWVGGSELASSIHTAHSVEELRGEFMPRARSKHFA